MNKHVLIFFILAFAGTIVCAELHAATLDCRGGIVSSGDSRVELLMKCGEPTSKESHQEELIGWTAEGIRQKTYMTVEEWTYDFGPSKLTRIATLKNGALADIRTGGYGYELRQEEKKKAP